MMFTKTRLALPAAAVTALAVAACGGSSATTHKAATAKPSESAPKSATAAKSGAVVKLATVSVKDGSKMVHSKILVNSGNRPIYLLTGDSTTHAQCTSMACLSAWPAVTSSAKKPALGAGVHGKLSVWNHKGLHQLVLNGHPLYLFAGDSTGTANGNGLKSDGGVWWVMNGSGNAAKVSAAATAKSSSGSASDAPASSGSSSGGSW
jgi:Secreted repeat of unknown function